MKKAGKRRLGFGIITVTVLVLCVVLGINKYKLDQEYAKLQNKQNNLEQSIEYEQERSEEIEEYGIYVKTKKFIKDLASSIMGLVDRDDVIIEEEK